MKRSILAIAIIFLSFLLFWPANVLAEDDLPKKAYIQGVKAQPQEHSLSCESRSAVDWAAYFGVEISEKKFLRKLPRSKNPDEGFVGRPDDPLGNIPPQSYGVHASPVADLLFEFGLPAVAQHDMEWDQLREEIAAGRPVIVWVIGQMWGGDAIEITTAEGATAIVAAYEHTMILVGYSPSTVTAIDAATGKEAVYSLRKFLNSWAVLGQMAITAGDPSTASSDEHQVSDKQEAPIPGQVVTTLVEPSLITLTPTSEQAGSERVRVYTVRRGDYLTAIAKKLGVSWRAIARQNNLTPPFILYTGQKLRIP